jgi:hypothetical protein
MKNTLFRQNGEAHLSYGTIKFVLEAGVYSILFPYEN